MSAYQILYNKLVNNLNYSLDLKKLSYLKDLLEENKKFFVLGSGRTGYVCEFFSSVFNDNKPFSSFMIGDDYKIESLKEGLLLVASGSGETPYVTSRLRVVNKDVSVVSLTTKKDSTVARLSDEIIKIEDERPEKKEYDINGEVVKHLPLTFLGTSFELKLLMTLTAFNDYYFGHEKSIKTSYEKILDSLNFVQNEEKLDELTEHLINNKRNRIFITGHYQCGIVSNYIINRWKNLGFQLTNPKSAESPRMKENDLVIIISGSGQEYLSGEKGFEHYYYNHIYDICKRRKVRTALITSNLESILASKSDLVIPIKGREYSKRTPPKKSKDYLFELRTMLTEAVITHELARRMNVSESQMRENHSDFV